ncbi:NUDIX domain-containing protein [Candidatus Micrarchaeota archaeon]|nr:NUDIX domain-containing protein [Candidatus Micrarchaeota archaeon]
MSGVQKFLIVVRALICNDGKVVLVRKHAGRPHPLAGQWVIPGGILEAGESPGQCAEREAREETGLRVRAVRLAEVSIKYDREPNTPSWFVKAPIILCSYRCEYVSGGLRAGDDVDQARWFSLRNAIATAGREHDRAALRETFGALA